MAVRSKKELMDILNGLLPETDEKSISIIEDFSDTFDSMEKNVPEDYEKLKSDYGELKLRYRERFMTGDPAGVIPDKNNAVPESDTEKTTVDETEELKTYDDLFEEVK